jgi:TolB-like protein/Tfp pilus assembly protein PilF
MRSVRAVTGFLVRLRQRKVVQWMLAYAAFAFGLLQGVDIVAQRFAWPDSIERLLILALGLGFCVALVFAWYHGERGAQKVSGAELLILGALLAIGGGLLWRFERGAPAIAASHGSTAAPVVAKSVAVLPFVNMSGDPSNDYFSDGITEEILNALAQVPDLKVAARTSAFAFKGKQEDLRKVGQVLDVAAVLEGSVQRAGDEVRITAQLIDTRSGFHLWSEKYDRKLTNIFEVEDEISKAITDKLQVQLAGGNGPMVAQKRIDPRAHDFYLRGLTLLAIRSVSDAVNAFQQAVAIDPNYAQAWAALAEAQALFPGYAPDPAQAAFAQSLAAAQRALALDPDVALAYVAQGMVYSNQMRWPEADRAFRRALALAPGDAEALNQYAQFLDGVGQLEPALAGMERALQRDPLSGVSAAICVQLKLSLHHYDAATAVAQIEKLLAEHPESLFVHRAAAITYLELHRYPEAETQIRTATMLNGGDPDAKALLVRGIADPSQRATALQSLETSPGNADFRGDAVVHAFFLVQLGARDHALASIEDYAANGNSTIPQLLWKQVFDPIRNDPRFKAALKEMRLPYTPEDAGSR